MKNGLEHRKVRTLENGCWTICLQRTVRKGSENYLLSFDLLLRFSCFRNNFEFKKFFKKQNANNLHWSINITRIVASYMHFHLHNKQDLWKDFVARERMTWHKVAALKNYRPFSMDPCALLQWWIKVSGCPCWSCVCSLLLGFVWFSDCDAPSSIHNRQRKNCDQARGGVLDGSAVSVKTDNEQEFPVWSQSSLEAVSA